MRHFLLGLCLFLPLLSFAQEEIEYQEYSYAEFFQMIADEESELFKLNNAVIKYDSVTDHSYSGEIEYDEVTQLYRTDTIYIDKAIELNNVQFLPWSEIIGGFKALITGLNHIHFRENVTFRNLYTGMLHHNVYEKGLSIIYDERITDIEKSIRKYDIPGAHNAEIYIKYSRINGSLNFRSNNSNTLVTNSIDLSHNEIIANNFMNLSIANISRFTMNHNNVNTPSLLRVEFKKNSIINVESNYFNTPHTWLTLEALPSDKINILANNFENFVQLELNGITSEHDISWIQWANKNVSSNSFIDDFMPQYIRKMATKISQAQMSDSIFNNSVMSVYRNEFLSKNEKAYRNDIGFRSRFYKIFKENYDSKSANSVYNEIKDLETQRLAYLYTQSPNFKTFFKWRINQFLKVFSAYGTEPERAIIFSVYVILAFAFVYLFFPNHWDSHGKDRILHRYQFFFKYLNKDAGMHDVYLDGKKDELAHYDGFKNFFIENGKTVPKFFLATALPLYKWSTASTRSSSWFLQKIDIFKGKWADLPAPQRAAKTVLLSLAFAIALFYDILIKMLNALMLSINTFTTLGFGEIPIKGLPRYLAIIQGFIGWFMLTIFSVSLISQLLN